ncbi:hypothetical protein HN51_001450 [Arachis hypogaea]|nr:uncharacterized protein DS421_1g14750 [Arachis hypogaea]
MHGRKKAFLSILNNDRLNTHPISIKGEVEATRSFNRDSRNLRVDPTCAASFLLLFNLKLQGKRTPKCSRDLIYDAARHNRKTVFTSFCKPILQKSLLDKARKKEL